MIFRDEFVDTDQRYLLSFLGALFMQHMAHFLCHYYTTIRPLYFDFIDFTALLYDKIRDLSLGLCLQSVLTSMSDVSILLRIYVWRVWMKRLQYLGTAERQGRITGTLVK